MKGMKTVRRGEKDQGNTEEMTTTQSAMLLCIVWADFPTQQGHWGWGPLLSAPLSEHLHSLSHYFPHPPPRVLFKDIILYKNTQLLSDGNAPRLWLSVCSGSNRRDLSQAPAWAECIQPSDWWTECWPGVTFTVICGGVVLGEPVLSLHSHLPLTPGGEVITWLT